MQGKPMSTPTPEYTRILDEITAILERFVKKPITVGEQTDLVNDLGLDSLMVMELLEEIEDTFDISFPLNNLSEIRTVGDFALQVEREIGA
jgi:acyl carrier protein